MDSDQILYPVMVQILLTIVLYIALVVRKTKAVRLGEVNETRRALYDDAWPEYVIQINNSIRNQFELPVLFYVLAIILWGLNAVDGFSLFVAWLFVISRIGHAFIHTGSNYVPVRRRLFLLGCFLLVVMCVKVVQVII